MRKNSLGILFSVILTLSVIASAHQQHFPQTAKQLTLQGEILDSACYFTHDSRGETHQECATKCIQKGIPMALITAKGEVYLLNEDHMKPEAYAQLKNMAAKTVTVTGNLVEKKEWKVLFVESVK